MVSQSVSSWLDGWWEEEDSSTRIYGTRIRGATCAHLPTRLAEVSLAPIAAFIIGAVLPWSLIFLR